MSAQQDCLPTDRATRVLVVDDHRTFADLLAFALARETDLDCVGVAGSAAAAVEMAVRTRPDMILLDIQLGRDSGLDAARRILAALPDAVVVVVSAHRDPDWVVRAAQAGASAFVPKSGSLTEMLSVLRRARKDSMLVAPSLYGQPPAGVPVPREAPERLTAREHQVLTMMGEGMAPHAIARLLNISVNTCRGYVKAIHAKLGARSQLEAVVTAQRLGILETADER